MSSLTSSKTIVNTKKKIGKQGIGKEGAQKAIQTEKAIVKLNQVTREAKMTMKFLAIELTAELVKNFKNDSIVVKMHD